MTFRNWQTTLRPASWRGVRFHVDKDSLDVGRRLVTHEFMLAERWYVEDIGADPHKAHVTAYVVGDSSDGQADALVAACAAKGIGTLSLPLKRRQARCDKCKRDFAKDKLGYIAFDLSFVLEPEMAAAGLALPVPYLAELVRQAAGGLVPAILGRLTGLLSTAGVASFVSDLASGRIADMAATFDGILRAAPLNPLLAPALLARVQDLFDNAGALSISGSRGNTLTSTSFVAGDEIATPAPLVAALAAIVDGARAAMAPDDLAEAFAPLAAYGLDAVPPVALTASARQAAANDAVLCESVRIFAVQAIAYAAADRTYGDRREAIAARATLSELIGGEMNRVSGIAAHDLFTAVSDLQGRAADYLSRRVTTLAPVVVVSAGVTLPSLWWSQRLYGTANRAAELRVRNSVIHPGFMPQEFEALAA